MFPCFTSVLTVTALDAIPRSQRTHYAHSLWPCPAPLQFESYSLRISELEQPDCDAMLFDENLLPAPPTTGSFLSDILSECGSEEISRLDFSEEINSASQSTSYLAEEIPPLAVQARRRSTRPTSYSHIPPRRTSLLGPTIPKVDTTGGPIAQPQNYSRAPSGAGSRRHTPSNSITSQCELRGVNDNTPSDPSPSRSRLSPQPPPSPCSVASSRASTHRRGRSNESISWLGTIDELAGSEAVPHHSKGSILDKYAGQYADAAARSFDFDDALDAAVDAAYDDRLDHAYYYNDKSGDMRNVRSGKTVSNHTSDDGPENSRGGSRDSGPLVESRGNGTGCLKKEFWDDDAVDPMSSKAQLKSKRGYGEDGLMGDFRFDFASSSSDALNMGRRPSPEQDDSMEATDDGNPASNIDSFTSQSAGNIALPTVTEDIETETTQVAKQSKTTSSPVSQHSSPQMTLGPAPTEALPPIPSGTPSLSSSFSPPPTPPPQVFAQAASSSEASVRSRRFKGNAKRLSINVHASTDSENNGSTNGPLFSPFPPPTLPPPPLPTTPSAANSPRRTGEADIGSQNMIDETGVSTKTATPRTSAHFDSQRHKGLNTANSSARASPVPPGVPSPTLTRTTSRSSDDVASETILFTSQDTNNAIVPPENPTHVMKADKPRPPGQPKLKKNISSSSLRSLKGLRNRGLSYSGSSDHAGSYFTPTAPITEDSPLNRFILERKHSFFTTTSQQTVPSTPTSIAPSTTTSRPNLPGVTSIYEMALQDPILHDAWDSDAIDAPYPLEACPQTALLRPYWLMRCLYQTIAHPRGGYLTTKLFIPQVVWQVNNVKLKAVPEKIHCCNQLTAALHKLAEVDMNDADAVNGEMQTLEGLLDQVQNVLSKKLGNEVGAHSAAALFKPQGGEETPGASSIYGDAHSFKSANSTKSYFTPWRKLRSKSSGASGAAGIETVPTKDLPRDGMMMSTLPMMDSISFRGAKRYPAQIQYSGPNSTYMSAVARLFDAAQILGKKWPVKLLF